MTEILFGSKFGTLNSIFNDWECKIASNNRQIFETPAIVNSDSIYQVNLQPTPYDFIRNEHKVHFYFILMCESQ